MALISRVSRLLRADLHAVLDHLEEPDVLLRQAVREMEEALAGDTARLQRLRREHEQDRFHDECGVVGVHGHAEAANIAYLGLYALQHRGQESAVAGFALKLVKNPESVSKHALAIHASAKARTSNIVKLHDGHPQSVWTGLHPA